MIEFNLFDLSLSLSLSQYVSVEERDIGVCQFRKEISMCMSRRIRYQRLSGEERDINVYQLE